MQSKFFMKTFNKVQLQQLIKLYIPFQICLIIIFGIHILPLLSFMYTSLYLFIPAICMATCNLISTYISNNSLGERDWDIVILSMSLITLIPIIGWASAAIGLSFSITSLARAKRLIRKEY